MCELTRVIEKAIEECKDHGSGSAEIKDEAGRPSTWVDAEWISYSGDRFVMELTFSNSITEETEYSLILADTVTNNIML